MITYKEKAGNDKCSSTEAMFKVERMQEIRSMIKPLNTIFNISTGGEIQIRADFSREIVQFINSKEVLLHELSFKDKSPLGFVKIVMGQV